MKDLIEILGSIADFFKMHPLLFWGFTGAMTLITLIFFVRDKVKAKKKLWRIPEGTLLLLCLCGGAVGGLLGMIVCRHKIRKAKFYLTVPFLAALQIAFVMFMYRSLII